MILFIFICYFILLLYLLIFFNLIYFLNYALNKSIRFVVLSLSDAIRHELKTKGMEETRDNLVSMGNQLRNGININNKIIKGYYKIINL